MNFALSDEQKMLVETVRRFILQELQPLEDGIETQGTLAVDTAKAVHNKAKQLGLYGLNMPEALGGGGHTHLRHCHHRTRCWQ